MMVLGWRNSMMGRVPSNRADPGLPIDAAPGGRMRTASRRRPCAVGARGASDHHIENATAKAAPTAGAACEIRDGYLTAPDHHVPGEYKQRGGLKGQAPGSGERSA
jgi:hypothetical protein